MGGRPSGQEGRGHPDGRRGLVGGLFAILLFTVLPTVLVGGLGKVVILTRWPRVILERC